MLLTLVELAESAGLSATTLEYYRKVGLIEPILANGVPRYGGEARLRLEIIIKGRQLGFSLSEIKNLIEANVGETPRRHSPDGSRSEPLGAAISVH